MVETQFVDFVKACFRTCERADTAALVSKFEPQKTSNNFDQTNRHGAAKPPKKTHRCALGDQVRSSRTALAYAEKKKKKKLGAKKQIINRTSYDDYRKQMYDNQT